MMLTAVSVLASFGLSAITPSQTSNAVSHPPPGRLIDIGGYKLHMNCSGKASKRNPTVILLHGLGDFSFDWALVQPEVARFTAVCSYDRAGQAWSDPGPKPRGPLKTANELHSLLSNAGIKAPYVLVGHSWGGIIARVYASQYPKEVAGIVLVDSAHEDEYLWLNGKVVRPRLMSEEEWQELRKPKPRPASVYVASAVVRQQAPRESHLEAPFNKLPLNTQRMRLWAMSLPRTKSIDEGGDIENFRGDFIAAYSLTRANKGRHPLGSIPLIVLTANSLRDPDYTQEQYDWNRKLQTKMAGYSSNGKQLITRKGEHHIQLEEPEIVVESIREVVNGARHRGKLTSNSRGFAGYREAGRRIEDNSDASPNQLIFDQVEMSDTIGPAPLPGRVGDRRRVYYYVNQTDSLVSTVRWLEPDNPRQLIDDQTVAFSM